MQTKQPICALGYATLGIVASSGHGVALAAPVSATVAGAAAPTAAAVVRTGSRQINNIKRLDIAATPDATRIVVEGDLPFVPDVRLWDRPSAAVITVPGVWNDGRTVTTDIRRNGVSTVRTAALQDTDGRQQVRIVANTRSRLTWSVQGSVDRRRWEITLWKPGAAAQAAGATAANVSTALFSSTPEGDGASKNLLRSLMDRRGSSSQPLVISAVYLRRANAAPAESAAATTAVPPLRQAGLAASAVVSKSAAPAGPSSTVASVPASPISAAVPSSIRATLPPLRQVGMAATDGGGTAASAAAAAVATTAPVAPTEGSFTVVNVPTPERGAAAPPPRAGEVQGRALPLDHHDDTAATASNAARLRRFFPAAQNSVVISPSASLAPTFTTSDAEPTGRRVSLDFVDADISEVLKALAVQSGINIILATGSGAPTSAIQNHITVSLHHMSFAEALDTVVNLSGYKYARIGNTYAVGTPEAVAALAQGASRGVLTTASIPFIFSDGTSLVQSILAAYPTMRGRVTLVSIGSEGKTGSSLYTTGMQAAGEPGGAPVTNAAGPATAATSANAAESAAGQPGSYMERVVPKGGVINVSGTEAEIDSVRTLVENTERALVDAPFEEQQRQSERFRGMQNEIYHIKYAAAPDLISILTRLVPNVYVTPGPSQGFKSTGTGQSVAFTESAIPNAEQAAGGATPASTSTSGPANTTVTVTSSTRTLILTGQPDVLAHAEEVLDKVDIKVPQVIYEAKVVDINSQYAKKLGLTYDPSRAVNIGEENTGVVHPAGPGGATDTVQVGPTGSAAVGRTPNFGAIYRTPYSIQVQLQAAITDNKAKVLSNPNLTALDGESATAFIGDQIKYVTQITQTTTGQNISTETATVGITLKVTGRTSPDGTITLFVHPEVSSITSFLNEGNGISLPQISTRYVDTTIRVKDGETIAIGGLISDTDTKFLQKVPLLGDIPFFGELFRFHQDQHNKSEVVVFITTRINND